MPSRASARAAGQRRGKQQGILLPCRVFFCLVHVPRLDYFSTEDKMKEGRPVEARYLPNGRALAPTSDVEEDMVIVVEEEIELWT